MKFNSFPNQQPSRLRHAREHYVAALVDNQFINQKLIDRRLGPQQQSRYALQRMITG